jgi:hypothetical protein
LMEDLQLQHAADQWTLIIDSSKTVWRQFYCIMGTGCHQYLFLVQSTWKKPAPAFKVCSEIYVTKTNSATYVLT